MASCRQVKSVTVGTLQKDASVGAGVTTFFFWNTDPFQCNIEGRKLVFSEVYSPYVFHFPK